MRDTHESHLIVKASHNSVTPASEIPHNFFIVHILPEELEEHADSESKLLLGCVEDRGWSSTMLSPDNHIQKVLNANSETMLREAVKMWVYRSPPEHFSPPTVE